MRIRIKFTKRGPIRYVGHLDFMRCFQKGIKKSGLPALYSAGFSPHMLMSFAAPLAIGEETEGDYVDVDFAYRDPYPLSDQEVYRLTDMGLDNDSLPDPPPAEEFCRVLTEAMPEGVDIQAAARVGLVKGSKAMALVRYASWELTAKISYSGMAQKAAAENAAAEECEQESCACAETLKERVAAFNAQEEIVIRKTTKKSERDVDIRPMIVTFSLKDAAEDGKAQFALTCASGSMQNLKPLTVLETFAGYAGVSFSEGSAGVLRLESFDEEMKPLSALGQGF